MRAENLFLLLVVLSTCYGDSSRRCQDWLETNPTSHPCQRPCREGQRMKCYYKFYVGWYYALSKACYDCPRKLEDCYREDCVPVDGVRRTIMVANRQLPGPSIQVCQGDKVIVDVDNSMVDESTSIHWHGQHQVNTPYMDGVPFVTQCPVSPHTVFQYYMEASNSGTHFWHSHTGAQKGEGLYGSMIVKTPDSQNPLKHLYDHDLSEHVMIINDWTHVMAIDKLQNHLHSSGNNKPNSILINGRGRWYNDSQPLTHTPLAVFKVKKGHRYRFRLINAGNHNCPMDCDFDNHNLIAIASDGDDVDPVEVDSICSFAGERYDFIVHASQPVDNYWIRVTGLMDCDERFNKVHQVAVLHYEGAPLHEPTRKVGYNVHPKSVLQLNPLNVPVNTPGVLFVPFLKNSNKKKDPRLLMDRADTQIYMPFDFFEVDHPMYHKSGLYGITQVNKTFRRFTPQFNHISFKLPSSPLLSQYNDVDPKIFCNQNNTKHCQTRFCHCCIIYRIRLHSIVEIILIDIGKTYNANHPFHLHGHAFYVIGMDKVGESVDPELIKKMDANGEIRRNLQDPPSKDTVTVPDGGFTVVRFKASNPGYWLLHCHIDAHVEVGMAVVFQIGNHDDYPPVPYGFPKCGNFGIKGFKNKSKCKKC